MNMAIAKRFVISHLNYFEEQKASFLIVTGKGLHQRSHAIFKFRDEMHQWLLHNPRLHKWFEDRLYTIDVKPYDGWVTCTKRHKRKL